MHTGRQVALVSHLLKIQLHLSANRGARCLYFAGLEVFLKSRRYTGRIWLKLGGCSAPHPVLTTTVTSFPDMKPWPVDIYTKGCPQSAQVHLLCSNIMTHSLDLETKFGRQAPCWVMVPIVYYPESIKNL